MLEVISQTIESSLGMSLQRERKKLTFYCVRFSLWESLWSMRMLVSWQLEKKCVLSLVREQLLIAVHFLTLNQTSE